MVATKKDVDGWIREGQRMGAAYIISVVDEFDWDDYPVFVMPNEHLDEAIKRYDGVNMQRINEVIKL